MLDIFEEESVSNAQIQASTLTTGQSFDLIAEKYHLTQIVLSMWTSFITLDFAC